MHKKVILVTIAFVASMLLWTSSAFAGGTLAAAGRVLDAQGATGTIDARYNPNNDTVTAAMAVITNPDPAPKAGNTQPAKPDDSPGVPQLAPKQPEYEIPNATTPYKGFLKGTDNETVIPPPFIQPPLEPMQWEDGSGIRATILYWEWSGYNQDTGRSIETKRTPAAPEPQTTYVFSEPGKYQITASAWTRYQPLKCIKHVEVLYDDKGNAIGLSDPIPEWVPDGPPYEDWGRKVVFEVTVTVDDLGKPIVIPSTETNVGVKVVKVDETKDR